MLKFMTWKMDYFDEVLEACDIFLFEELVPGNILLASDREVFG